MKKVLFKTIIVLICFGIILTFSSCSNKNNQTSVDTTETTQNEIVDTTNIETDTETDKETIKETDKEIPPIINQRNPYELFSNASDSMNNLKDLKTVFNTYQKTIVTMNGETSETEAKNKINSTVKKLGDDKMNMEMTFITANTMNGYTLETMVEIFMDDENIYYRLPEEEFKVVAIDSDEGKILMAYSQSADTSSYTSEVSEEQFYGCKVEDITGGGIKIILDPSNEYIKGLFKESVDSITGPYQALGIENLEVKYNDINIEFTINIDGYLSSSNLKTNMTITGEMPVYGDVTINMDMTIDVEFIDPGETFDILFPTIEK